MKTSQMALAILVVIVTIALAFGSFELGYFIQSNKSVLKDETASSSSPSETAGDKSGVDRVQTPEKHERLTIKDLSDPDRFESRIARTAALLKSLQDVSVNELKEILDQSKSMQAGSWQREIQNATIQRLAVLDPTDALTEASEFSDARQQTLLPIVYREWALANLDQAIESARNLDGRFKPQVIESIVRSRADLPTDHRRKIARSLDKEWIALQLVNQDFSQEPISDPKQEVEDFLSQNPGPVESWSEDQTLFLANLLINWLTEGGLKAFGEIEESLPDGFLNGTPIVFAVGLDLAENNPELALQLSVATGSLGLGGVAWFTARRWAQSDPAAAFGAVSLLEGQSLRRMLQDQVLATWAAQDAHGLLVATRTMPKELQSFAQEKALSTLAESSPQSASKLLGDIEDRDARDRTASNIASSWARLDINGALEWIENDQAISGLQVSLYQSAINSLVRINPQLAINTAIELPVNHENVGPEADAFRWLGLLDLDLAIHLLPQARSGPTKVKAYGRIVSNLLSDHKDFRQAMDLFVEVAKEEVILGFNSALHSLVFETPIQLFESLDEIPSEDLKKRAAGDLLVHESKGLFSDEQLAQLRELSGRRPAPPRSPELDAAFEEITEAILESLE